MGELHKGRGVLWPLWAAPSPRRVPQPGALCPPPWAPVETASHGLSGLNRWPLLPELSLQLSPRPPEVRFGLQLPTL